MSEQLRLTCSVYRNHTFQKHLLGQAFRKQLDINTYVHLQVQKEGNKWHHG